MEFLQQEVHIFVLGTIWIFSYYYKAIPDNPALDQMKGIIQDSDKLKKKNIYLSAPVNILSKILSRKLFSHLVTLAVTDRSASYVAQKLEWK